MLYFGLPIGNSSFSLNEKVMSFLFRRIELGICVKLETVPSCYRYRTCDYNLPHLPEFQCMVSTFQRGVCVAWLRQALSHMSPRRKDLNKRKSTGWLKWRGHQVRKTAHTRDTARQTVVGIFLIKWNCSPEKRVAGKFF